VKVNKAALFIYFFPTLSFMFASIQHFPFISIHQHCNKLAIDVAIINGVATSAVDREKIVYHISVTRDEHRQLYLQLIIIDRYEYDEHSSRLMEYLRSSTLNSLYAGE
jgi:hypothetical protein